LGGVVMWVIEMVVLLVVICLMYLLMILLLGMGICEGVVISFGMGLSVWCGFDGGEGGGEMVVYMYFIYFVC